MAQQLTLGIKLRDEATFENFFPGKNSKVLFHLKEQQEPYTFMFGLEGTGKTHLLQAACHQAGESSLPVVYLPLAEAGMSPQMLEGLENMSLIALDDIQAVISIPEWEEAIFHLFNRVRDRNGSLLVASDTALNSLEIKLADLRSRLSWGPVFQLMALTDEEKIQAIEKRAKNRGLVLEDGVIAYLLKHHSRHMGNLFAMFEELDRASMVEKRKLTIPFIKNYL